MPHLTLEYSGNCPATIRWHTVMAEVHGALMTLELFRLEEIKSRAVGYDQFLVGDGAAGTAFVHLTVAILSGREPEVRVQISQVCLQVLRDHLGPLSNDLALDITVDVRELERQSYAKVVTIPPR